MIRSTRSTRRRERLTHPPGADRTGAFRPVPAAAALAAAFALGAGFVVTGSASAGAAGASPEDPIVVASPGELPEGATTAGAHRDEASCEMTQIWMHTETMPARIEYYGGGSESDAVHLAHPPVEDGWERFGDPEYTLWQEEGDAAWSDSRPGQDTALVQWVLKGERTIPNDDDTSDAYRRYQWLPQGDNEGTEPPAWPNPAQGRWQSSNAAYDETDPAGEVYHRGNGHGSWFYWEVIEGSEPSSTTEYQWQKKVREATYRYQRERSETTEVTYYASSDGTTECPDAGEGSDPAPGTTENPAANEGSEDPAPGTTENPDANEEPDPTPATSDILAPNEEPATPTTESRQPLSNPPAPTAHRAPETVPAADREAASTPEVPTRIAAGS